MTEPTLPIGVDGLPIQMDRGWYGGATGLTAVAPLVLLEHTYLTDDEKNLVERLAQVQMATRFGLELQDAYYHGQIRIPDLGISIPPQMRQLHTAIGWPRICVDALDERLDVQGFRLGDATEVDEGLQDMWLANSLDSESQLGNVDALVFGRGFVAVGSPETKGDAPVITVESPLDMAIEWDARTRTVVAALRLFDCDGVKQGTLYTATSTISLIQDAGGWEVLDRDDHNLGVCPLVRIPNRPRSYSRDGMSEITTEIMSITDAACRTLQGLEVAREFYSAPQRYVLGADAADFEDAEGNPMSGWQTYLGRILGIGRDADGNVPTVGQFTPYDPATFTKVIDMYAKIISSISGLPPHVLGYTTDNPASADAIRSSETRLKLKADRKTRMFGTAWRDVMKLALLIRDGELPTSQITTAWANTATPTPAATTDSVQKQVAMGYLPAESDVTGEMLGYDPVQRQRIEIDRARDKGESLLAEVASSLVAKETRQVGPLDKVITSSGD